MRQYRIDFALITLTGNITRYQTMRPLVEHDPTVRSRWYPIRTWVQGDWLRFLPGELRVRARQQLDNWRMYIPPPADAAVIHAFETYPIYAIIQRLLRKKTVIIFNPDGPLESPAPGLRGWPRRAAIRSTSLMMPWSTWSAQMTYDLNPPLRNKVVVLHPGIDLEKWPQRPPQPRGARFRLLFIGGDLQRKGAAALLDAFDLGLGTHCDLELVTQSAYLPPALAARIRNTPHVRLHLDLTHQDDELRQLYATCDAFILPTKGEASSWVALEAMATGLPVIITPVGGIPDIVHDGETGLLIAPEDPPALVAAVERLRQDESLCTRLIRQGRAHVEAYFNAHTNTARMLTILKTLIDGQPLPDDILWHPESEAATPSPIAL